jgi:hypothetical protein
MEWMGWVVNEEPPLNLEEQNLFLLRQLESLKHQLGNSSSSLDVTFIHDDVVCYAICIDK